jgi:hypothetical protein
MGGGIRFDYWALISPILSLYIVGFAIGRLVAEVWKKAFSYCIPGQIETSRKMIFLIGLVITIIISLVMVTSFYGMISGAPAVFITLVSFYLMFYSLTIIITIQLKYTSFVILYFLIFGMPNMGRLGLLTAIEDLLLNHPWLVTFFSCMVTYLIYCLVGRRYLSRSMFFTPWQPFLATKDNSRPNRFKDICLILGPHTGGIAEFVNHLFSKRIQSNNRSPLLPLLWGRVYIILGALASNWQMIFFGSIFIFFFVYIFINNFHEIYYQPFLFGLLGVVGGKICVISGSDILLPLSRRDRFFSGITALITAICIMLVLASAFVLLSKLFASILPPSIILGRTSIEINSFQPVSFQAEYIFLTAIVLPTIGGLFILFQKRLSLSMIVIASIVIYIVIINFHLFYTEGHIVMMFNSFIGIMALFLSSGFHLVVLYYDSIKRSLF